jgi:hypothetical protein
MLKQDGTITFRSELMEAIDTFLAEYETRKGPLSNDLERGLVISYILGMMCCELEAIWNCVGKAPVFSPLHPRIVFEECIQDDAAGMAGQESAIAEEIIRRGWLSLDVT